MRQRYRISFIVLLVCLVLTSLSVSHAQEKSSYLPPKGRKEFMTADEFLALQAFKGKPAIKKGNPARGRELYVIYCTVCHGLKGKGDGPLARLLDPEPKDHTKGKGKRHGEGMNEKSDAKLMKAIREGGLGVRKSVYMPSFGHLISEKDLWNLLAYLRTIAIPPYVPPAR